jgi:hypothetical protein
VLWGIVGENRKKIAEKKKKKKKKKKDNKKYVTLVENRLGGCWL